MPYDCGWIPIPLLTWRGGVKIITLVVNCYLPSKCFQILIYFIFFKSICTSIFLTVFVLADLIEYIHKFIYNTIFINSQCFDINETKLIKVMHFKCFINVEYYINWWKVQKDISYFILFFVAQFLAGNLYYSYFSNSQFYFYFITIYSSSLNL